MLPTRPAQYVAASSLKLRGEPRADAKVLGRLKVNSSVEPLEVRDGFTRVRVGNGREGWVGSGRTAHHRRRGAEV